MKFKSDCEFVATDDPYYDLFDGGYIDPHAMLEDAAVADEVCAAMQLIRDFIAAGEESGHLEVC